MNKKISRLYVAPEFKVFIKTEAAKTGCSILDYTRNLAENKGLLEEEFAKKKNKPFTFRL